MDRPEEAAVRATDIVLELGGKRVLDHVSLTVGYGEKVVLIGPSGSGKSSLLRCLNGLEVPEAGRVEILGVEIGTSRAALQTARRSIGTIFQQFNLYSLHTALDNVALAPRKLHGLSKAQARKLALAALERVGIGALADRYPFQLSGGQKQRVAIARALATRPRILLLDEPTSALDPELVRSMLDLIQDVVEAQTTVLCVTHELGFARRLADRVVFLVDGRIEEEGKAQALLEQPRSARLAAFLAAHRS